MPALQDRHWTLKNGTFFWRSSPNGKMRLVALPMIYTLVQQRRGQWQRRCGERCACLRQWQPGNGAEYWLIKGQGILSVNPPVNGEHIRRRQGTARHRQHQLEAGSTRRNMFAAQRARVLMRVARAREGVERGRGLSH